MEINSPDTPTLPLAPTEEDFDIDNFDRDYDAQLIRSLYLNGFINQESPKIIYLSLGDDASMSGVSIIELANGSWLTFKIDDAFSEGFEQDFDSTYYLVSDPTGQLSFYDTANLEYNPVNWEDVIVKSPEELTRANVIKLMGGTEEL
ncbi:hypothetical protein KC669_04055 [Candidatus Dojkabacteria bacterium]|uniref:Uncharacterized protein n=1 Tax=Candidatus Dojkabacteria bacterium TaxID=2099670 RepID=A0A955LBM8_9BACT|nr:hypothetical protein [Candidatus Dojkabacteria bacterium]